MNVLHFIVITIIVWAEAGLGLRCYTCISGYHPPYTHGCGEQENLLDEWITDCRNNTNVVTVGVSFVPLSCIKVIGTSLTERKCGIGLPGEHCTDGNRCVYRCNIDLCNSRVTDSPSARLGLLSVAVSSVFIGK